MSKKYMPDVDAVLARRHDNGGDYWASADGRLGVGDPWARHDQRYREALRLLQSKLDARGRVVVERPNRKLAGLSFCAAGRPSELATGRYRQIVENVGKRGRRSEARRAT